MTSRSARGSTNQDFRSRHANIDGNDTPKDIQDAPVDVRDTAIDAQDALTDVQDAPVDIQDEPMDEVGDEPGDGAGDEPVDFGGRDTSDDAHASELKRLRHENMNLRAQLQKVQKKYKKLQAKLQKNTTNAVDMFNFEGGRRENRRNRAKDSREFKTVDVGTISKKIPLLYYFHIVLSLSTDGMQATQDCKGFVGIEETLSGLLCLAL